MSFDVDEKYLVESNRSQHTIRESCAATMASIHQIEIATKQRLDGDDLRAMFSSAVHLLEANVEAINALNVFPVPDGDTGINMFLTLQDSVAGTRALDGAGANEVARVLADGALKAAKGNSGVILSQFFEGLAVGLQDSSDFGPSELASALREARDRSYRAVGEPKEGTMLTVVSDVARTASEIGSDAVEMQDFLLAVCEAARESVALTPTLLPVLREAGVVDAGGQGLLVILEGARRYAAGEAGPGEVAVPEPVGIDQPTGSVSHEFLDSVEEEVYGYCTQFLVEGVDLDPDDLRARVSEMGRSAVVVGNSASVQVHVHAEDPGPVISLGAGLGALSSVKVENMDAQRERFSADRREEEASSLAVVVVAWGDGFVDLFRGYGADQIVTGGDTMNPSVGDLLQAIDAARSETVIVLPNNSNIVPAAEQAARQSSKDVRVVTTKSIPQGVAAMLEFNVDLDADRNVEDMNDAMGAVRTGQVTEAVRGVTMNGVRVEQGMVVGMLEREVVAAGEEVEAVVKSLVEAAQQDEIELVTLYRGAPMSEAEAQRIAEALDSELDDIDVELVEGGQPHYHFLISME